MTREQLFFDVRRRLEAAGISMPELEARELTACALGVDRQHLLMQRTSPVSDAERERLEQLVARRLAHEPLAYLLGEWDFCGITLRVTPDVLIPRSDTERLCELAALRAGQVSAPRVLDLCSGSGCIALALLKQVPDAQAVGVDVSPAAVVLANENAQRLRLSDRYEAVEGDALTAPPADYRQAFDVLVCNPPYITAEEMRALDPDVSDYEPHLALYGGTDGLDFYRTILDTWAQVVKPGGALFFECGWKQGEAVASLCRAAGWQDVCVHTDYAGIPRIVTAEKPR